MALPLTTRASQLLGKTEKTPQMVLQIDGVQTLYGAVTIKKIWKIGDPEIIIGTPGLLIGGQVAIENQETLISWDGGTSNTINQVLNPDKGENESVSSLSVALLDKGLRATKLITPGNEIPDLLGANAKIWVGPDADGSWKDDYNIIFRGVIDDIDAKLGIVKINLAQGGRLNRSSFLPAETELNGAINDVVDTINVLDTSDFIEPFVGPGGLDTSIKHYIRVEDEIIQYTGFNATQFTGCVRGQLGTVAASHSSEEVASSFYRIEGNAIDLALKFMLSGDDVPYLDAFPVSSFNTIPSVGTIQNAIFLADFDIEREYNVRPGDFVSCTGASDPLNDFTDRVIQEITLAETGYYIVVDGDPLVTESPTGATISIKSQYNAWGPGAGLGLKPEEVDIEQHLDIKAKYLSSAEYDFYIKEEIEDGKEFLSQQIYNPVSSYSVPRKAQASIAYNAGPIPGQTIKTLNTSNVLNANSITTRRTTNKRFYNTIVYKFEENPLEDIFERGTVFIDSDSVERIKTGNKALTIESKGLREILSGINIAQQASSRRLKRYRFAAEFTKLKTNFETGFDVEIADKIVIDFNNLKITDIITGTRSGDPRLYEVVNKTTNLKTGEIELEVLNTNTDLDARFALVGPASKVKSGANGTEFVIDPSYNTTRYGSAEWKKWVQFEGTEILVRSPDYTVVGYAILGLVTTNTIVLDADLGFTPQPGYIMELSNYNDQTAIAKLKYSWMSDADNDFADGKTSYKMS